jgi:hypothetical protein
MEKELINERQDSISLSRTSKGQYSWDIKLYYNIVETSHETIITKIAEINNNLKERFKSEVLNSKE